MNMTCKTLAEAVNEFQQAIQARRNARAAFLAARTVDESNRAYTLFAQMDDRMKAAGKALEGLT